MTIEVVLSIAGILLFVYGILGVKIDIKVKDFSISTDKLERWQRVVFIVIGSILVILALMMSLEVLPPNGGTPTPSPTIPPPSPTPDLTATLTPSSTPTPTASPTQTHTPTPSQTPTDTPTPTQIATPTPLDAMDNTLNWKTYTEGKGSTITIHSRPGLIGNATEIIYDVIASGYIGMSKDLPVGSLDPGDAGLRFYYSGSGVANTIELKLLYTPDSSGESEVFSVEWPGASVASGWIPLEALYDQFKCWPATGCAEDEKVDPERVWRIDFAISNKYGGTPGEGTVMIDEVQVISGE
jgi:hypothetical protein